MPSTIRSKDIRTPFHEVMKIPLALYEYSCHSTFTLLICLFITTGVSIFLKLKKSLPTILTILLTPIPFKLSMYAVKYSSISCDRKESISQSVCVAMNCLVITSAQILYYLQNLRLSTARNACRCSIMTRTTNCSSLRSTCNKSKVKKKTMRIHNILLNYMNNCFAFWFQFFDHLDS